MLIVWWISYAWVRLLVLWHCLRRFLHATAATPLGGAFGDVSPELSQTLGLRLMERPLDVAQLDMVERPLKDLAQSLEVAHPALASAARERLPEPDSWILAVAPALFATRAGDQLAT